jgi:hypothetical protein
MLLSILVRPRFEVEHVAEFEALDLQKDLFDSIGL